MYISKILSLFLVSIFYTFTIFSAIPPKDSLSILHEIECAPQLAACLTAIVRLPEGRELISSVQKKGAFSIRTNRNKDADQFAAYWDGTNRSVIVCDGPNRTTGSKIGSIIFELHNALADDDVRALDSLAIRHKINRDDYIERMERIEYQNAIKASAITTAGIRQGIFPTTAHLPVYKNFEEHYRIQKTGGHSAWFAARFDEFTNN